jgi:hypothetical protein
MFDIFNEIIRSIHINQIPNLNPTEIYNEGWMTRLLVYISMKQKIKLSDYLDFSQVRNWTSEGLISSPFIHAENNKEGYTHADMVLGDFQVNYKTKGQIEVFDKAKLFGIIEAKMGSNLSQGTSYAKEYNQASRNLACISYNSHNSCKTFFGVVAPETMIEKHGIENQIQKEFMIRQVESRYELSKLSVDNDLINRAQKCKTFVVSYEYWISLLNGKDKSSVNDFYKNCIIWNRLE